MNRRQHESARRLRRLKIWLGRFLILIALGILFLPLLIGCSLWAPKKQPAEVSEQTCPKPGALAHSSTVPEWSEGTWGQFSGFCYQLYEGWKGCESDKEKIRALFKE